MLVSGHNISTTEVESALVGHPAVAEAAVVGATDPTTGQAIVAFVILKGGADVGVAELREHVSKTLGPICKPRQIMLRADKTLDYGRVMRIMGELNRAGLTRIALVTTGSEDAPAAVTAGSDSGQ